MTRARRSLRDRDNTAIDPPTPAPEPQTEPTRVAVGSAADAQDETADSTTTPRKATAPHGTQRVGVYFRSPEAFENAKSAYLSDWEHRADSANTFARWAADAIEHHAALSPDERRDLVAGLERPTAAADQRSTRTFMVPTQTRAAATAALAADGRAGRWSSISEFCGEAIDAAIERARSRAGGVLSAAPARLPNRLHR